MSLFAPLPSLATGFFHGKGMILSAEREPQECTRRRWVIAQLFGLSAEQVARIRPLFPREPGVRGMPLLPMAPTPPYNCCRRW